MSIQFPSLPGHKNGPATKLDDGTYAPLLMGHIMTGCSYLVGALSAFFALYTAFGLLHRTSEITIYALAPYAVIAGISIHIIGRANTRQTIYKERPWAMLRIRVFIFLAASAPIALQSYIQRHNPADVTISIFATTIAIPLSHYYELCANSLLRKINVFSRRAQQESDFFFTPKRMQLDTANLPTPSIRPPASNAKTARPWLQHCIIAPNGSPAARRAFDFLIALRLACLTSPILLFSMLLVIMFDGGAPIYVQTRIGKHGKQFQIYKIRTMYCDASSRLDEHLRTSPNARREWDDFRKLKQDPRVIPHIGRILRRSSIDELPQLWNVLRGDMAIVGPRPLPDYHLHSFDIEFQTSRMTVLPGITGLCQISARGNANLDHQRTLDMTYIASRSFWLDLYIMLHTPLVIVSAKGAF